MIHQMGCRQCHRQLVSEKQKADGVCCSKCREILEHDPTPEEIQQQCAEIRSRLSPQQELLRSGGLSRQDFEVPFVAMDRYGGMR